MHQVLAHGLAKDTEISFKLKYWNYLVNNLCFTLVW